MDVVVLGHSIITSHVHTHMELDPVAQGMDSLPEFAGRACYQAFDKPNPKTARNSTYLANILDLGHESVLEHSTVTFYITGVSRSLTHELVRHRHLSPSQQSQRYVDESESVFILPPLMAELLSKYEEGYEAADLTDDEDELVDSIYAIEKVASHARTAYARFVRAAERVGIKRKPAREAARSILPNGTETRIVMTGNLRAWRHMINLRHSVHADREIQELAGLILYWLRIIAPNSVQDIPDELRN